MFVVIHDAIIGGQPVHDAIAKIHDSIIYLLANIVAKFLIWTLFSKLLQVVMQYLSNIE